MKKNAQVINLMNNKPVMTITNDKGVTARDAYDKIASILHTTEQSVRNTYTVITK